MADITDDDSVAVAATVVLCAFSDKLKRKRKREKWVQTWIAQRPISGAYHALVQELQASDAKSFQNFLRMDMSSFNILMQKVGPSISKQNTTMRDSISAEERLAVTLRYLATGV